MKKRELVQHREAKRHRQNVEVVQGIRRRNPKFRLPPELERSGFATEAVGVGPDRAFQLETIVLDERPVLFVRGDWITAADAELDGLESRQLFEMALANETVLKPLMPLIGRIDVTNFPNSDFVGTGWFVDRDIVVTNRHVAELIARRDGRHFVFAQGVGGRMKGALGTQHEFDDLNNDPARSFEILDILYIEPESGPNDIAFLKVARTISGEQPYKIEIAKANAPLDTAVVTVGYPARAPHSVIPDQARMEQLYRGRYDVKRAAPGFTMADQDNLGRHDCTTLGGASGSPLLKIETGEAVGLHFAGLYHEANYIVRATTLRDYIAHRRWSAPIAVETGPTRPGRQTASAVVNVTAPGSVTIPLSITIAVGTPIAGSSDSSERYGGRGSSPAELPEVEAALKSFWSSHQSGVIAARVGFDAAGDVIGDTPHIAASLLPSRIGAAAGLPQDWDGVPVHYYSATVEEQLDAQLITESSTRIAYDDDDRTGKNFAFTEVRNEDIEVLAHVGPEYSWDVLQAFLAEDAGDLVSAMYEFHGDHIRKALEARLAGEAALKLIYDNATLTGTEFDAEKTFSRWRGEFGDKFDRIKVPEGNNGLISDSYHIKVTVREDDKFWLSSGNWKSESSQPIITQQQRDDAADTDLPGNREWHVVIRSKKLATLYRSHIEQDLKRSRSLLGLEAPELMVEVPPDTEAVVLERRPPGCVIEPKTFKGKIAVKPLLTPDHQGAVYSEAVLDLIRSAQESLWFQIPYIGMPSNPATSRGFIDDLIAALTDKLKTLPNARVLLRAGSSKLSSPAHAAWYFKSKGVDIADRVRRVEDSHTKGMIVDGRRLLLGSHNWSGAGVTLNRDASLIFDHKGLAEYYAEAFDIDWRRSNPIAPKQYVKKEEAAVESAVISVPRVPASAILSDELFS